MTTIFNWIFNSYQKVYALVFGGIVFLCYFLIGKNFKNKAENDILNTKIEEMNNDSKKIMDIQNKQAEIASRPSGSRDDLHKWMRDLQQPSNKR